MILQQLTKDYERILAYDSDAEDDEDGSEPVSLATPAMYDLAPVKWEIRLDDDGNFLDILRLVGSEAKKDLGLTMLVPTVVRTVGVRPLVLADTPAYVLGMELEDTNSAKKHRAFVHLIRQCAEETDVPAARAVVAFLSKEVDAAKEVAAAKGVEKSDRMTFRVGNTRPIHDSGIQAFWATRCEARAKRSVPMQCLICGNIRPAVESMPFMIKGLPDGQSSGTALVSFNIEVFESYGLNRAANSPICAECAEKFSKALKALMRSKKTRHYVGSLVYVFWTVKSEQDITDFLAAPSPEDVRELLKSVRDGVERDVDADPFYALLLSANAARVVVRGWISTTVGQVRKNIAQWFEWQEIVDANGNEWKALPDWRLAASLYRPKAGGGANTQDIEKRVSQALIQSALQGSPLPLDLLHRAVMRNRAENNVTYERAALMTAVLRSQGESELETPAQTCGKLLAILEDLQRQSAFVDRRKINATLVDRFFGAASTSPATVFGTLLADAQAHLTKLRKTRYTKYDAIQCELETTLAALDGFPPTLNMKQQALFSLGYYHQRAAQRKGSAEGFANNQAQAAALEPTLDIEPDSSADEATE